MDDSYGPLPRTPKPQPKYYVLNYSKAHLSVDFLRRYRHLKHKKKADTSVELRKDVHAVGSFLQTYFLDVSILLKPSEANTQKPCSNTLVYLFSNLLLLG